MSFVQFLKGLFGKAPVKAAKGTCSCKPQKPTANPHITVKKKEKEIGVITHYYGNISVGIIKLKDSLCVGDRIHVKGAHDDFVQKVGSMQVDHKDIQEAAKGVEVGIKVVQQVHENDKVYMAA